MKSQRSTHQRISSVGDELWNTIKAGRQEQEKFGEKPKLGLGSKGAFVNMLPALYKDGFVR